MSAMEWKRVGASALYIQSFFTTDTYSIWITDMYRLWHEKLGKKQIERRAREKGLQIDLSDANNLRIVLEHLSTSLRTNKIEADNTTEAEYLELSAKICLPKPLPEASWMFKPTLCTPDEFRQHVTEPLFDKIHSQEQSELDLIQRIKDKDHVIEKLLDQVDKASIDLASIFPALAPHVNARKGLSKREAEALVPALASFDSTAWRRDLKQGKFYRGHSPMATRSAPEDDTITEHALDESMASPVKPAKGIKKKIGGKKASPPPAAEFWGLSDSQPVSEPLPEPISAPKGIKKKIGGRKPSPVPEADQHNPTKSPETRPKGIKKTIGGRKPLADNPDSERSPSPAKLTSLASALSPIPDAVKDPGTKPEMTAEEEVAEAERLADEKRKALRLEMETKPAPKKKRKF